MKTTRKIKTRLEDIITDEYKEQILNEIKQFVKTYKRVPRRSDFSSIGRFIKTFGSFSNAVMIAGFEPGKGGRKPLSKEYCIEKIRQFVNLYCEYLLRILRKKLTKSLW